MIQPTLFPPIDPAVHQRLVKQARAADDAAMHTLIVLSTRPHTQKIQLWPHRQIEIGVN